MKILRRWVLVPLAILLLAVASNQCLTRGYLYSEINTLFSWSGSAQAGWNGSLQNATYSDFDTYIANNGSCGGTSLQLITYGAATSCAVNYALQTLGITSIGTIYTFSPTVISASYPINYSWNVNCLLTATGTYVIKNSVGGVEVSRALSSGNESGSGSITSGTTGSWSAETSGSCTIESGNELTYYN